MFLLIGLLYVSSVVAQRMDTVFEWNLLQYNTPLNYLNNSTYRADMARISSIEIGLDRIFFAVPELFADNPASLVYVPRNTRGISPSLEAYPNWSWHGGGLVGVPTTVSTCHGFISVQRLRADRCGRLWALDSGLGFHRSNRNRESICQPKLVAFDMYTNEEVRRIMISKDVLMSNSDLWNFAIDDADKAGVPFVGNCDTGHIYVADMATPGLITINLQTAEMWRHSDPALWPNPDFAKVTVDGESFVFPGGIYGMTLSNPGFGEHRDLYFKPIASSTVFSVNTAALKRLPSPIPQLRQLPVQKMLVDGFQGLPISYDPVEDKLLFSPLKESTLMAYDLGNDKLSTLSNDTIALEFVSDIHSPILDNKNIWVVPNRLNKVFLRSVNPREINQRVMRLNRNTRQTTPKPTTPKPFVPKPRSGRSSSFLDYINFLQFS